jgi:hypothetical protein
MKILLAILPLLLSNHALGQSFVSKVRRHFAQDSKPWGQINLILEPVGDYDYVLPPTKTDEHGQYRFSDVSWGGWSVFVQDKEAGYPDSGRLINWFLYGRRNPQVRTTNKNLDAQLNVTAPPRPGQLRVNLVNSKTRAKVKNMEVQLRVKRKREVQFSCDDAATSCEANDFLVPPDQDVRLHITSQGFREWKESAGHGKLIHVETGDVLTIRRGTRTYRKSLILP